MNDKKIKTIVATGAIATTLGINAITNGVIQDGERKGGTFVSRQEWNKWKDSFQQKLWNLDQTSNEFIAKRLEEKDKEGYLDRIKIWQTATSSTSRGEAKKEEE